MCGSIVDIHSATAEIRRGKKEVTTGQKYNVRICYTGRPQKVAYVHSATVIVTATGCAYQIS